MHRFRTVGRGLIVGASAAMLVTSFGTASADWQPTEQITLVSQSSAGAGNDLLLRELNAIWTKTGMVPVAVTNENVNGC